MVLLISKHQLCVNHAFVLFSKSMVHMRSRCLLHTWNNDYAVSDIPVLCSTFEITQLAVVKGENMITNYLSFCSGSFYCMPFTTRCYCNRPIHRPNHRSKPFVQSVHCLLPKLAANKLCCLKYWKSWFFSRMAREYLIRVCTCNVGERPVSFFPVACSVFSVFRIHFSPRLWLSPSLLPAPFSHGLKALVWSLRCSIFTRCFGCPRQSTFCKLAALSLFRQTSVNAQWVLVLVR